VLSWGPMKVDEANLPCIATNFSAGRSKNWHCIDSQKPTIATDSWWWWDIWIRCSCHRCCDRVERQLFEGNHVRRQSRLLRMSSTVYSEGTQPELYDCKDLQKKKEGNTMSWGKKSHLLLKKLESCWCWLWSSENERAGKGKGCLAFRVYGMKFFTWIHTEGQDIDVHVRSIVRFGFATMSYLWLAQE